MKISKFSTDRQCLFCLKKEPETSFLKEAHIVPQNLGGTIVSESECDRCNEYFGQKLKGGYPSVDLAVKEFLYISKFMMVQTLKENNLYKGKPMKDYTEYYKLNAVTKKVKLNPVFRLKKNIRKILMSQFRNGLWKIAFEYFHELTKKGFEENFDEIREVLLADEKTSWPVLYQKRKLGMVMVNNHFLYNSVIMPFKDCLNVLNAFNVFEFELLGHVFAFPLTPTFENVYIYNEYRQQSDFKYFFHPIINLKEFKDFDLMFSVGDNEKEYENPFNTVIEMHDRFKALYPIKAFINR